MVAVRSVVARLSPALHAGAATTGSAAAAGTDSAVAAGATAVAAATVAAGASSVGDEPDPLSPQPATRSARSAAQRSRIQPIFSHKVRKDVADRSLDPQVADVVVGGRSPIDDRQRRAGPTGDIGQARHRMHLE